MLSNSQCRDQLICTDQAQTFVFVATRFEFELYIYICGQIWIWIIFFFTEKSTVGAVLDWTALTNTHSRGGWWYSRPYRSPLQGRLILPATPTESTVGAAGVFSCHYRGHCRGSQEHPGKGGWRSRPYRGSRAAPTINFCSSEFPVGFSRTSKTILT